MRLNIVIDDALMDEVMRATGLANKRAVVELGLKTLLQLERQKEIRTMRGMLAGAGESDVGRRV